MNTTTEDTTMTAVTTEPGTSALDVLKSGACSPSCLLSQETGRCACRCQGAYHGTLLSNLTDNTTQPERRTP